MKVIEFIIAISILAIMPGPDILFVITQSLNNGWKRAMFVVFGLMTGLVIYTIMMSYGAGNIISKYPMILTVMKYFSVFYLLYLGVSGVLKRKNISSKKITENSSSKTNLYLKGIIMNLANPKIMFFFLALFTPFLSGNHITAKNEMLFLGGIFVIISFIVFSFFAFFSDKLKKYLFENNNNFIPYLSLIIYIIISFMIMY